MNNTFKIDCITLRYGDAEFTFYNIKLLELYTNPAPNATLHAHTHYELHFLTSGCYLFQTPDENLLLNAGSLLIIPPNFVHYAAVAGDNFDSIIMQFQLEKKDGKKGLYDYFERTLTDNAFKSIPVSKELMADVKDFRDADGITGIEAICFHKAKLSDLVYRMFKCLNGYETEGAKSSVTEDKSDILFLIDHMVTSQSYTLEDIARKTGYSTRNISRIISAIYKTPLSEIRRKYHLETAKKLLISNTCSMEEIAALSGFKNVGAMRNAFRKYEGTTPSDYKNKTEKKE